MATPLATGSAPAADGAVGVQGRADAPVTIIEFSDFQCPYCRRHALRTLPKIKDAYIDAGQVRYLFKDFPLPSHANAQKAAQAARCAGALGAFWDMHHRLFEAQSTWARQEPARVLDTFVDFAADLGLDAEAFRDCLETEQFVEEILQDQQEGQRAGVPGTPTFLINGQLLDGAYPFETFQQRIEAELQKGP